MSVSNLKKYPLKQITTITESARNFDICSKKSYTKERRREAIIELWVTNVKRGTMLLSKLWQSRWNVENLWSNTLYYTIQGHHLLCNIFGRNICCKFCEGLSPMSSKEWRPCSSTHTYFRSIHLHAKCIVWLNCQLFVYHNKFLCWTRYVCIWFLGFFGRGTSNLKWFFFHISQRKYLVE